MRVDTKEFELPDTVYIRDIDSQVFQSIVLECLSKVAGIHLASGGLIESLLGLENKEALKAISIDQDPKNHSVDVRVEVNVAYGVAIPSKAEEIQSLVAEQITKLTGLHVGSIHVVFKNIYFEEKLKSPPLQKTKNSEYSDEF